MVCDPWNSLLQNLPSGCFESEALEGFVFCESIDCMLVGWLAQHPVSKKPRRMAFSFFEKWPPAGPGRKGPSKTLGKMDIFEVDSDRKKTRVFEKWTKSGASWGRPCYFLQDQMGVFTFPGPHDN